MKDARTGAPWSSCLTSPVAWRGTSKPITTINTRNSFLTHQLLLGRCCCCCFCCHVACNTIRLQWARQTVESLWLERSFFIVFVSERQQRTKEGNEKISRRLPPTSSITYGFVMIKQRLPIAADLTTCETVVYLSFGLGLLRCWLRLVITQIGFLGGLA